MKENATHIRLIRDKDGKPVEAEYCTMWYIDNLEMPYALSMAPIPVTGDWPTDRDVFAMDEVEPVKQYEYRSEWRDIPKGFIPHPSFPIRTAYRLKATLSDDRQSDSTAFIKMCHFSDIPVVNEYFRSLDGIYHDEKYQKVVEKFYEWLQEQSEEDHIVPLMPRKVIPVKLTVQSEVTVKEGELKRSVVGFAPGDYYHFKCKNCENEFMGSKRSWLCEPCAIENTVEVIEQTQTGSQTAEEAAGDYARSCWGDPVTNEDNASEFDNAREDFLAGVSWAKQQYQQEIIESIEAEIKNGDLQKTAPVVFGAFKRAIEIIQSTK